MTTTAAAFASEIAEFTKPWSTSKLPTETTLTHIDPQNYYGLVSTLKSITLAVPTMTEKIELYHVGNKAKAAQASLSVISAQRFLATATATQDFPRMTSVIWNATMELQQLEKGLNLYQTELNVSANAVFVGVFAFLLLTHLFLLIRKRTPYFGFCFFAGTVLEFAGYLARVLSVDHYSNRHSFLCQIISLTLAPALIMAGVYFLLAQITVVHGREYSVLKPLWYSYIFVTCDLISLVVQAAGGGDAAIKLQMLEDTKPGTHTMVAGIAFQVVLMSLFLYFLFDFMFRVWFRASLHVKFLARNFYDLLFNTSRGQLLRQTYMNDHYDPHYEFIWSRKLFGYFPLVLLLSVGFIYIRCLYRLVELSEGWTGFLITHEVYIMTLDALMVFLTVAMFVPFHPGIMMGAGCDALISVKGTYPTDVLHGKGNSDDEKSLSSRSSKSSKRSSSDKCYSVAATTEDGTETIYEFKHSFLRRSSLYKTPKSSKRPSEASTPVVNPFEDQLDHLHSFSLCGSSIRSTPIVEEGIVAIPYSNTKEQESMVLVPTRSSTPPKKRGLKKISIPQTVYAARESVNPYERFSSIQNESISTLGPYEQYETQYPDYEQPGYYRQEPEYYGSVRRSYESQVTHDEDLFDFGIGK